MIPLSLSLSLSLLNCLCDLFMNAYSCYMALDQGCSVPHRSVLLPLMSTKISLCLCCYSNMHRMNAAGHPSLSDRNFAFKQRQFWLK